jgi:chromosomal replication initiator protein
MDANELWQQVLADLQISLTAPVFKTFLAQTVGLEYDGTALTVGCPNTITVTQLNTKHRPVIEQSVVRLVGGDVSIKFIVHKAQSSRTKSPLFDQLPESSEEPISETKITEPVTAPAAPAALAASPVTNNQLNPNYTFDQFVVGNTNRVAHAAALAVTDNPGKNYNPFFLYGGTGVGKTHLVQAIGNALIAKKPQTHVLYCSIERFMNDFIYSIRFKTTNEFKQKYRSCDVLIVDDIQFIAGDKASTQEEFFHTYNELHASGRQIILCSDRPPREIESLADRMVSRFEGGLSVDIAPPDFETRAAIIQAKADRFNMILTPEIVEYLANQGAENIRSLEGMMLKLQTLALANPGPLKLADIQVFLGHSQAPATPQPINPNALLKLICETYGITLKELSGKTRTQNLVIPRQIAMYLLRNDLGLNLETIGQMLGGRDHTTVMHGVEKVTRAMVSNDQLRASLQSIRQAATK